MNSIFADFIRLLDLELAHRRYTNSGSLTPYATPQERTTVSQCVQTFLACTSRYKKGIYKRTWFTETVEMDFEGMKVPVSAYYDELLTVMYGDYMQLPSEEDRKIKEHAVLIDAHRNYSEYENYRDGMKFDVYTRNIH